MLCEGLRPCSEWGACTFLVERGRYQKYGELFRNTRESYPMRDRIAPVMRDTARVGQALGAGESGERVIASFCGERGGSKNGTRMTRI